MSSYAQQLQREHIERRNRLHPVQPPRIPLSLKIIRTEPEVAPELLVWPSRDMIDHSPWEMKRYEAPEEPAHSADLSEPEAPAIPGRILVRDIQRAVCLFYDVKLIDMLSSRRTAEVVKPRQVAMYLAKTHTLRALPDIGRRFAGKDHTTVLHAVRKITGLLACDAELESDIRAIEQMLGVAS